MKNKGKGQLVPFMGNRQEMLLKADLSIVIAEEGYVPSSRNLEAVMECLYGPFSTKSTKWEWEKNHAAVKEALVKGMLHKEMLL